MIDGKTLALILGAVVFSATGQLLLKSGAKVNPEHSHPFDVRAMVVKGALTLTREGASRTYKPGETFAMPRGCLHYESYGPEGAVTLFGRKM